MNWYTSIYVGLLRGVSYLHELFDILSGAGYVVYDGQPMTLFDLFFRYSAVSSVFWGITIIGLALAVAFAIISITRRMADLKVERTMGATLGHIGKTMLMFFITPLMVISVLSIVSAVMTKSDELFYIANGGSTLDSTIFAMTARNAALENPEVIARFASGELSYSQAAHVTENLHQPSIMSWLGIPVALMLIVFYMFCLMALAVRLFLLILLYLISPFFVSSMVLDDGTMYKAWRSALFARLVSGFSLLISMKILTYIIVPFLTGDIKLTTNAVGDIALKCLFACGSVYAMYKSAGTLAKIISPRTESDDAMVMGFVVGGFKKAVGAVKAVGSAAVGAVRLAAGDVSGASQIGGAALSAVNTASDGAGDVMDKAGGEG